MIPLKQGPKGGEAVTLLEPIDRANCDRFGHHLPGLFSEANFYSS